MSARSRIAVAVLALGLLSAACTDEPAVEDDTTPPDDTGDTALTVDMRNFQFLPGTLEVASGEAITLRNSSTAGHTFTVEDIDVVVDPEGREDVTIGLAAGDYDFVCRFHEGQGMVGTLTVT